MENNYTELEKILALIERNLYHKYDQQYDTTKITNMLFYIQGYCLSHYNQEAFKEDIFITPFGLLIREFRYNRVADVGYHEEIDIEQYKIDIVNFVMNKFYKLDINIIEDCVKNYPLIQECIKERKESTNLYFLEETISKEKILKFFQEYFTNFTYDEVFQKWITSTKNLKKNLNSF